jgi:hypothetical protein
VSIHDFNEYASRKKRGAAPSTGSPVREDGTVLLGVFPGPGRRLQVLSHVAGYLAQPLGQEGPKRRAIILAASHGYQPICSALEGCYTSVRGNGDCFSARTPLDGTPMLVYDFTDVSKALSQPIEGLAFGHPDTLLVIDDASEMLKRYPHAFSLATRYAKSGSGVMVMGETEEEVRAFELAHKNVLIVLPENA